MKRWLWAPIAPGILKPGRGDLGSQPVLPGFRITKTTTAYRDGEVGGST